MWGHLGVCEEPCIATAGTDVEEYSHVEGWKFRERVERVIHYDDPNRPFVFFRVWIPAFSLRCWEARKGGEGGYTAGRVVSTLRRMERVRYHGEGPGSLLVVFGVYLGFELALSKREEVRKIQVVNFLYTFIQLKVLRICLIRQAPPSVNLQGI